MGKGIVVKELTECFVCDLSRSWIIVDYLMIFESLYVLWSSSNVLDTYGKNEIPFCEHYKTPGFIRDCH